VTPPSQTRRNAPSGISPAKELRTCCPPRLLPLVTPQQRRIALNPCAVPRTHARHLSPSHLCHRITSSRLSNSTWLPTLSGVPQSTPITLSATTIAHVPRPTLPLPNVDAPRHNTISCCTPALLRAFSSATTSAANCLYYRKAVVLQPHPYGVLLPTQSSLSLSTVRVSQEWRLPTLSTLTKGQSPKRRLQFTSVSATQPLRGPHRPCVVVAYKCDKP
jgi:hypothetical protein